jgi:D-sedoheptulose 7-phosphate isomerase
LSTNTSVITAHSNDSHFEDIFSRQVESLGKEGDVLFGLSTSGNSENVIKAFEEGKKIETLNILMTGKSGGKLKGSDLIDVSINIDSDDTARIQEIGMFIYHIICDMVEKKMFGGEE